MGRAAGVWRLVPFALASMLVAGGCAPTIGAINARPERYYHKEVRFIGQIRRMRDVTAGGRHGTVLELASAKGARILAWVHGHVDHKVGDWVRVRGTFEPELVTPGGTFYDAVDVKRLRGHHLLALPLPF